MLFARALFAFLVLPGLVAFVVPLSIANGAAGWPAFSTIGALPLAIGVTLLLWCVRDFYVVGKGTLAPWSPPKHLVTTGPYRASRNPMYVAVTLILLGWAIGFQSRGLAFYALVVATFFHLRVVVFEEPWLGRTHGQAWTDYQRRVRRWL
jgi:protein-S-isoprenylcysteine O-methyltransferase Ste14